MSRDQSRRLQLAREHAGYRSGRMAALRLGWKYPTYAAHESGLRTFPPKVAAKYARAFNVHPDFLTFGTRPPEWWDGPEAQLEEVQVPAHYMTLFSGESADAIETMIGPEGTARRDFFLPDTEGLSASCFAVRVSTEEMVPLIPMGSIVVFDPDKSNAAPGSVVLLSVKRQVAPSIRKVKAMPGGRVRFAALSEDYDVLDDSDAKIIGVAVMHVRRM